MHNTEALRDIRAFESFLGDSHRCLGCGRTFLQHEDGCPDCGAGAPVESLHRQKEIRGRSIGVMWIDQETGEIRIVNWGDSCLWPREEPKE
ncbi:MAG: hypothetical protein HY764_02825 [Candidatus Portnoybacteria bacterium]|nr:hypothetical protein [Candidatus Portnoybacteria bacterium]